MHFPWESPSTNLNGVQAHRDSGTSQFLLAAVELAVDEVEEEVDVDPRLPEHVHHRHALVLQLKQLLHEVLYLLT